MSWLSYFIFALLLAFSFYSMDLFYKLHQDIKFIKNHIEKNN